MPKISDNVYAESDFRGCNPGFVVTREGVVMIDTPQMPADAVKWRDEIAKHGPVRYLINTEPHGDRYPVQAGLEAMAPMLQRMNVAGVYQWLKSRQ